MSHTLRFGVAIAALMVLRAPASAQAQPRALHRRRLRARREIHAVQHDAARLPRGRPRHLAGRRPLLVPHDDARRRRVRAGRSGAQDARPGVRPREARRRAVRGGGNGLHGGHLPFTSSTSPPTAARSPSRSARSAGRATCRPRRARPGTRAGRAGGRTRRPAAARTDVAVARRQADARSSATGTSGCATIATGKETQLTTDGVKDFGYATDNAGWSQQRPADPPLVARLEEDRHLPAGPARRRRHVPGRHDGRPSDADRRGSIRCRATRSSP